MRPKEQRLDSRLVSICIIVLVLTCHVAGATEAEEPGTMIDNAPYPVGERLSYAVSYMGIHCGHMEITSFVDEDADGEPMYRIVVLARTTKFFDGIYRLRSRLDSFFDPRQMTSVRYEEHSVEKKKRKDEVWAVNLQADEVVRTKNGEITRIPIKTDRAYDPLAFIFRLRVMDTEIGSATLLDLMTSKGAVETIVRATKRKVIRTKMGKCDAVAVVPEPRDKMMFSKSGSMVIWIDQTESHRPCKIEFDLSFGTLVASLAGVDVAPDGDVGLDWENWGSEKKGRP